MRARLFIKEIEIGNVNLEIIDSYMGVLSGNLIPNENYNKFKNAILRNFESKGISNSEDFNYRLILKNGIELNPEGGIGIIHSKDFIDKILIETAGNNLEIIKNYG